MNKNELVNALNNVVYKVNSKPPKTPLLDFQDPKINVPTLIPTKYVKQAQKYTESAINAFVEDLDEQPLPKPMNEKVEALKRKVNNIFEKIKKYELKENKSAIKGFAKQHTIDGWSGIDLETFLSDVTPQVISFLSKNRETKVNVIATCLMERVSMASGEVVTLTAPFVSKTMVNLAATDVYELYSNAKDKILESMANFQMRGSNWRFKEVLKLDLNTVVYKPLKGSSYIKLPDVLAKKKAIINMQNQDDQCFKWCITRALNPVDEHAERITKQLREQSEKLNWKDLKFPMSLKDIDKFEKNNCSISVNVYGYESSPGYVYPLRISNASGRQVHIDLLLISDGKIQHYCLINSLSRLLSSQTSKTGHERFFCRRCLNDFCSEASLEKHMEFCKEHDAIKQLSQNLTLF